MGRLRHPNVALLIGACSLEPGRRLLIMEHLPMTLYDALHAQAGAGAEPAWAMLKDVAAALAYTHARLIIHRDVKPDNFLVGRLGPPTPFLWH